MAFLDAGSPGAPSGWTRSRSGQSGGSIGRPLGEAAARCRGADIVRASRVVRALREAPGARTRGPTQRVPKNTPDASRTSRPLSVSFNRTARPEGFAIQYSVRPQGSGLVRTARPEGFATQRTVPPDKGFPAHALTTPKDQNAQLKTNRRPVSRNHKIRAARKFLWIRTRFTHNSSTNYPQARGGTGGPRTVAAEDAATPRRARFAEPAVSAARAQLR